MMRRGWIVTPDAPMDVMMVSSNGPPYGELDLTMTPPALSREDCLGEPRASPTFSLCWNDRARWDDVSLAVVVVVVVLVTTHNIHSHSLLSFTTTKHSHSLNKNGA
jgi:hypothetical protein